MCTDLHTSACLCACLVTDEKLVTQTIDAALQNRLEGVAIHAKVSSLDRPKQLNLPLQHLHHWLTTLPLCHRVGVHTATTQKATAITSITISAYYQYHCVCTSAAHEANYIQL